LGTGQIGFRRVDQGFPFGDLLGPRTRFDEVNLRCGRLAYGCCGRGRGDELAELYFGHLLLLVELSCRGDLLLQRIRVGLCLGHCRACHFDLLRQIALLQQGEGGTLFR
jgi:hypothetical protein